MLNTETLVGAAICVAVLPADGPDTASADPRVCQRFLEMSGECTVVAVPTHGFGNRIRLLASAHAFASLHGCGLQAIWRTTLHMPVAWQDLFSTALPEPDDALLVRYGANVHSIRALREAVAMLPTDSFDRCEIAPSAGHTEAWIDGVDPHAEPRAVLVIGGHDFRSQRMRSDEHERLKREFYRRLVPMASVATRVPDTRGHACVHYREHGGDIDITDGQPFKSPKNALERFVAHVARLPPGRPLFVASTSAAARDRLVAAAAADADADSQRAVITVTPSGADARTDFLAEWIALTQCASIVGSPGSTFSGEAALAAGVAKEIPSEPPEMVRWRCVSEECRRVDARNQLLWET